MNADREKGVAKRCERDSLVQEEAAMADKAGERCEDDWR